MQINDTDLPLSLILSDPEDDSSNTDGLFDSEDNETSKHNCNQKKPALEREQEQSRIKFAENRREIEKLPLEVNKLENLFHAIRPYVTRTGQIADIPSGYSSFQRLDFDHRYGSSIIYKTCLNCLHLVNHSSHEIVGIELKCLPHSISCYSTADHCIQSHGMPLALFS